jgi:hypothetical protein
VLVAAATVLSQFMALCVFRARDPLSPTIRFALLGLCALVLAVSFSQRRHWNTRLATGLFVLNVLPFYFAVWLFHVNAAKDAAHWVPFETHKGFFPLLAVLVPGAYWVNVALMLGFVVEGVIIWRVLDLPHLETVVLGHEPWLSILFVVFAAGLFMFRIAHDQMARELERTRSRAEMLERVARIFLSVRDRANTPLQTLRLAAAILHNKHPEAASLADAVSRSADHIACTSELLARFESKVQWPRQELMTDEEIKRLIDAT